MNSLFKYVINNSSFHNEDIFESFSSIENYKLDLEVSEQEFEVISVMLLNKCPECREFHRNMLLHIYPILSEKLQEHIKAMVNDKLNSAFDKDLYYLSVLANIIDYRPFFDRYLNQFIPPIKNTKSRFFFEGEIRYRELNDLMNLVFKTKAKLKSVFKEQFSGLSNYYDWLIDMHTFDYSKFEPIWLIQYPTKYYLQEAFSNENVRVAVRRFLKVNNQPTLAFYYTQYVK